MPANQSISKGLALKTQRDAIRRELATLERHMAKKKQMQHRLEERIWILMQDRRAA